VRSVDVLVRHAVSRSGFIPTFDADIGADEFVP